MNGERIKQLKNRDPITDEALRTLLNLFMVSDPWPLSEKERSYFFGFLLAECHKRGYSDVIEAYHEFEIEGFEE